MRSRTSAASSATSPSPCRSGRSRGCGAAAIRTCRISSSRPAERTCSATADAIHPSRSRMCWHSGRASFFCRTSRSNSAPPTPPKFADRGSSARFPAISSRGTERGRFSGSVFYATGWRSPFDDAGGPDAQRLFDRIELPREEVIGAGDDHRLRIADLLAERFELLHVAMLVLRAVQDQHWLLARTEVAEVVFVNGCPDQEERINRRDLARGARRDPRAERKSADDHFLAGMLLHQPVDRGNDVALLAFAFLVMAGACARAAEVESERRDVRRLESARGAEDDFVVQRAAAERMRVANHRHGGGILQIAIERLELAGARKEIDVAERFRVHSTPDVSRTGASLTRMRSPSTFTSCVAIVYSALPGQRPVRTSNPHRCHGQTISSPMRSPSASGPPRCGQVLSVAKNPRAVCEMAMVRSSTFTALMRPTGSSAALRTSVKASFIGGAL